MVPLLAEKHGLILTVLLIILEPIVTVVDFRNALWLSCNKVPTNVMVVSVLGSRLKYSMQDDDKFRRETGSDFLPKFDAAGLITAVVQDATSKQILMLAHMNAEAVTKSRETGVAHFYSRSRGQLWMKGETSGNTLSIRQILVDCDQDALVLVCNPAGPACHTDAVSCFYRLLDSDEGLIQI